VTQPYTVLVLCTGNSCRSQMAEVLLNHDLAGQVRALSAGTRPQPKVADGAIAALKDAGLNTDGLHPKDIDAVMNEDIDLVVTVCDNAKEACPIFPKPIPAIHLPFHDPHGEPLESFSRCATTSAPAWWPRCARSSACTLLPEPTETLPWPNRSSMCCSCAPAIRRARFWPSRC
jgi:arsenate reductase (thioredoxin)